MHFCIKITLKPCSCIAHPCVQTYGRGAQMTQACWQRRSVFCTAHVLLLALLGGLQCSALPLHSASSPLLTPPHVNLPQARQRDNLRTFSPSSYIQEKVLGVEPRVPQSPMFDVVLDKQMVGLTLSLIKALLGAAILTLSSGEHPQLQQNHSYTRTH